MKTNEFIFQRNDKKKGLALILLWKFNAEHIPQLKKYNNSYTLHLLLCLNEKWLGLHDLSQIILAIVEDSVD